MMLPNKDYLKCAVQLLADFNWLFTESNTFYLKNKVLKELPMEWSQILISNYFNLETLPAECPDSLRLFLKTCSDLKCRKYNTTSTNSNKVLRIRGVNPKKLHEILQFSTYINSKLQRSGGDCILVDLGSGLGYASQRLYESGGHHVLGLEADSSRVAAATTRQDKYFPSSKASVKYAQHFITEDSDTFIYDSIEQLFPSLTSSSSFTLFGLHSCGDLSITAINLFFKMPEVRSLIIMPCCYHKMQYVDASSNSVFKNFPLSRCLQDKFHTIENHERIFNRPFLRLACQETAARWQEMSVEDHRVHGRNMFERALVEAILEGNEQCVKTKHKAMLPDDDVSFENLTVKYTLIDKGTQAPVSWNAGHAHKCDAALRDYPDGGQLSECLSFFQTMLQEICEQVVLKDRLCYAHERADCLGIKINACLDQIVNDKLSPRCYAFVLEKIS